MRSVKWGWVLVVALMLAQPAVAGLEGEKTITLASPSGPAVVIGTISFTKTNDGHDYDIKFDDSKFADHFLSMRPFKCLEGSAQYLCHLPYPYDKKRQIMPDDFADLEHEFLFIHKKPNEYGINMWNGIYYVITAAENGLTGRLHEIDMDILASPPEGGVRYPLLEAEKTEGETDAHWLPVLHIE